jgi:aflatoxin B1 aldehyde reductase
VISATDRTTPFETTLREVGKLHREGYFTCFRIGHFMACEGGASLRHMQSRWLDQAIGCVKECTICCIAPSSQSCFLVCDAMIWYSTATIRSREDIRRADTTMKTKLTRLREAVGLIPTPARGGGYQGRYMNEGFFAALDILRLVAKKQGLTEAERALG